MSKIDKSFNILDKVAVGGKEGCLKIDPRSLLLVTIIYLCLMLGVPSTHIDMLLWYAIYPIITSPLLGLSYATIFLQSLIVLPLVLLLGIFNPVIDHTEVARMDGMVITRGWLLFFGVIIRGLLSMQALLIMIHTIGFIGMVRAFGHLGLPRFLLTPLLLIFRYIRVLMEESLSMKQARDARSYGNKKLSLRMWGILVGQLFLRSIDRAERVHKAMLARGFNGYIPMSYGYSGAWSWSSTAFLMVWCLVFIFLRLFNLSLLFAA